MTADEIWDLVKDINPHYSMDPADVKFILDSAQALPAKPKFLELGVCHGRTFAAISMLAQLKGGMAFGIDHFGLEGNVEEIEAELSSRDIVAGVIYVSNTHSFPWTQPIDLLIIDAGHDEFNVSGDIKKYLPFVKPGGLVFFDDYDWSHDPKGAHEAIWRLGDAACADWIDLNHTSGRARGWRRP